MNRSLLIAVSASALVAGSVGILIGRGSGTSSPSESAAKPEAPATSIELTQAQLRASGIELITVAAGSFDTQVSASGEVAAQLGAEGVLAARADGTVVRLFKRLGDPVAAGEIVAYIESQQAADISAQRHTAAASLELAQARYRRELTLYNQRVTARQDLETARAELATAEAEAQKAARAAAGARVSGDGRTLSVTSPTSGSVSAAPAMLGAFVSAGTELYRVLDPRRFEFRVSVPAADASRIARGAGATVQAPGAGTVAARVRSITPGADPVSRAAMVILAPVGSAPAMHPGLGVRATISALGPSDRSAIIVPAEAVQLIEGRDVVFVRTSKGFRAHPVTIGQRTAEQAEIVGGLSAGAVIAGQNAFLIKAQLATATDGGDEQ